ncbi:unnamed protein product, partial [Rotaria sp. Silwood2]
MPFLVNGSLIRVCCCPSNPLRLTVRKMISCTTFIRRFYPLGFQQEALVLSKMTLAFVISHICTSWMLSTVSLAFMGHLGQAELNASGLAFSVYNLLGSSIIVGLNFAAETLMPQYFSGDKQQTGLILQRGAIIAGYACFTCWILMLNAGYVLKWIQGDQEVLTLVNRFIRIYIFVLPFDALSLLLGMYIASSGRTVPLIIINMIGNAINVLSHYICLYHLHLGICSTPVSMIIAYCSIVLSAIIYIRYSPIYIEAWCPIDRKCLQEWNVYLKLAIPGVWIAIGQQKYAAIVSFVGLYIIGLPMAYIFMFIIHMDIYGYWIGMIVASSAIAGILFVFIWRLDWNAMAQIAIDRIHFDKTLETVTSTCLLTTLPLTIDTDESIEMLPFQDNENDE